MVEFEIEWDDTETARVMEHVGVPPFIEAGALPPVGSTITWADTFGEEPVEITVTVTEIELNIFEDHKGLYTVYVNPVN